MWESQVLLTDGQVFFPRVLQFSPTSDERSAWYKWNILERAVNPPPPLRKKKKKKKDLLSTLGKIFSRQHLEIFFLFFPENRSDISCKLSPMETICMKFQIPFSGKNKKNVINLLSAELAKTVIRFMEIIREILNFQLSPYFALCQEYYKWMLSIASKNIRRQIFKKKKKKSSYFFPLFIHMRFDYWPCTTFFFFSLIRNRFISYLVLWILDFVHKIIRCSTNEKEPYAIGDNRGPD